MAETPQPARGHTPTLLFDGDCGFCTTSAQWAERHLAAARTQVIPWQRADLAAFGLTPNACAESVKYADASGRVFSGAAAAAALLREGRRRWRWLGVVLSWPGVRSVADVVYRVVSKYRHRLPGGTPACRVDDRG